MPKIAHNLTKAQTRKQRVRSKIFGTTKRPRVTVFRSNKFVYIQAINDETGKTLAMAHDKQVKPKGKKTITKTESATESAKRLAAELKKQKVAAVVFDRGHYRYHGRVKAVAEALREEGINV